MAEVGLDSARVRPVIGKLLAAGMAQREPGLDAGPHHELGHAVPR
jgi:hypothetical protein